MDWVSKAAELNRNGVSCLHTRHVKLALQYFKGSLEILSLLSTGFKECESYFPEGESTSPPLPASQPQLPRDGSAVANSNVTLEEKVESPTGPSCELGEASQYLYEKGLVFATSDDLCPELFSFYIAVVEFNMALSLQVLSRRWGERFLCNAIRVYDHCLGHLHASGCDIDSCNTLFFAALNNKAAIFYDMSNFDMARDVLGDLLKGINECRKSGSLTSIDNEDLEGFLFNVMLFKGACIAPAA